MTTQTDAITIHGGATVNGVQMDTQVIMRRQGFDKWPNAKDGLDQWEAKVKAMDLFDVKDMSIHNVRMSPTSGGFYGEVNKQGKPNDPANAIPATKTAIGHLLSYVKDKPDNTLNNLLDMSLPLRTQRFHELLARPVDRNVVLRTGLTNTNQRVIRAVVSEVHSQEKGDDLSIIQGIRQVADLVPTAKLRVIRRWDATSAELILPNAVVQAKVGVTLYGRLAIYNSETKGGSYTTEAGSMNLVCLNGMVRPGNSSEFRVRHMGDIGYRVRQSIRGGIEGVMEHLNVFKEAYSLPIERTRPDVIAAFGKAHELPEGDLHAIAALWDVDGELSAGDTLAGLVNAVTRHAQSLPVEEALAMERVAGERLHRGLAGLL